MGDEIILLPCPFCGSENISMHEGETFRWRKMACNDCSASCGEFRYNTLTSEQIADTQAKIDGANEWNSRA
jgi:transcription elongation factor Elf1